jgi:hypothetical protein
VENAVATELGGTLDLTKGPHLRAF